MSAPVCHIAGGLVFDVQRGEPEEQSVTVADGRIVALGEVRPATTAIDIDARGAIVIPGLIDAHFHAYGASLDVTTLERTPVSYLAHVAAQRLASALRRGFTTVRDVAGADHGLARAIGEGRITAPRLFYGGKALSQTGGHGDARRPEENDCLCQTVLSEVVDGPDAVRVAARDRLRHGAHHVKVFVSGGVVSPSDPLRPPQYSPEELQAVVAEAEGRGAYVVAHAYSSASIRHALDAGIRTIEHGNLLDEPTAAAMAETSAFLVPTLIAYDAMARRGEALGLSAEGRQKLDEVLHAGAEAVQIAASAGISIGLGSDLMGELESEQLRELHLRAQIQPPIDVLRSATTVNAAIIGRTGELGCIAPGARADLVLSKGTSLNDSGIFAADPRMPEVVISRGQIVTGANSGRVESRT